MKKILIQMLVGIAGAALYEFALRDQIQKIIVGRQNT